MTCSVCGRKLKNEKARKSDTVRYAIGECLDLCQSDNLSKIGEEERIFHTMIFRVR